MRGYRRLTMPRWVEIVLLCTICALMLATAWFVFSFEAVPSER